MSTNRRSPSGSKIGWQEPVATAADLPVPGAELGEARVTLDTGAIWTWSGVVWVSPSSTDELVKVTAADTTPNYLSPKLAAGAGITLAVLNPGANEQVQITATAVSEDHKVKATAADTTPDFLSPKIAAGANVTKTVLNPGANEQVELAVLSAPPSGPAGGDLTGTYPNPSVDAITEAFGPTSLPIGAVPVGSVLARVGGAIVGVAPVFIPTAHAPTHRPATGTDPLATAAPGSIAVGDAAAVGVGDSFSRNDHVHALPVPPAPADVTKAPADAGVAATVARSDHKHDVTTAAPAQGIGGGNTEGVATTLARSDHDHTIRETGGPTDLTVGVIADGQAVVRSGTALVGANVAGGTYFWGAGNVATTAVTRFLQPGYQTGVAPTTGVRIPIRRSGTLRNLTMQNRVVGVGAALITFTLLKNGVATALAISVAATAASGSDVADTVTVVAGDFIELRVTKAAVITTSPTDIEVAVDFGP